MNGDARRVLVPGTALVAGGGLHNPVHGRQEVRVFPVREVLTVTKVNHCPMTVGVFTILDFLAHPIHARRRLPRSKCRRRASRSHSY